MIILNELFAQGFDLDKTYAYIKSLLKNSTHDYCWKDRADGDDPYNGVLDRIKLNRKEGYEMVPFIWSVFERHDEVPLSEDNVYALEDKIQEIESVMKEEIHDELDDFIADWE